MENIEFTTKEIADFFSRHRNKWDEFYPSEKEILTRILCGDGCLKSILDVGCAVGGLGHALHEKFGVTDYTGLDINKPAIEYAENQDLPAGAHFRFIHADIAKGDDRIGDASFDNVISLGCVDWNVCPQQSIEACWRKVKPGGSFVASVRLTPEAGVNDIEKSYQHIGETRVGPVESREKANYVVYNIIEALEVFTTLNPSSIEGYGYWGKPSETAVTPYERLVFSVFSIRKKEGPDSTGMPLRLEVPVDALLQLENVYS